MIGGTGQSFFVLYLVPCFGCSAGVVLASLKETLLFRIMMFDELGLCSFFIQRSTSVYSLIDIITILLLCKGSIQILKGVVSWYTLLRL